MLLPLLALLQGVEAPVPPRRAIADSGVIATNQQVTPAGVQSVFTDRVFGVRFGAKPGEIWVSIHGAAYRLNWRDNAVLGSAAFDGRIWSRTATRTPDTASGPRIASAHAHAVVGRSIECLSSTTGRYTPLRIT